MYEEIMFVVNLWMTNLRKLYDSDSHADIVHKFNMSVSHILRICLPNVIHDWFPVILFELWRVPHVGQEIFTLSGSHDSFPFVELMISPIHCIYTTPNL